MGIKGSVIMLGLLYFSVANGEPPIGIPWETFQKKKKNTCSFMKRKEAINMEYIYIKVKPEKWNDFIELLDSKRIIYSYIGRKTIMIHKMYFVGIGKILDNSMIESFASSIEGL